MSAEAFYPYLLVMAGVTYLIRMLPLTVFRREIRSPFLRSFLYYVPYAVLGAMTVPDIFYATGSLWTALAGLAVAVVLAWKEKSLLMVAVFSLLITVIIFLFGNQLLSLFLDPGDASGAMGYGLAYMHTVSLFYILMGLLFVPNGMLRGAGDMAAFTFSSMANLFSRVGIAYALVYLTPLGANAIWWSIPAGWLIGAAVSLLRVKSGKWMRKAVADR